MNPLSQFESVWLRCSEFTALHAYLAANVTEAMRLDEILRAEWVARISALDMYVHELVSQEMVEIFEGRRSPSNQYLKFQLSIETVERIRRAVSPSDAVAAFDLDVRNQLSRMTFQDPEKIADAIRLFSEVQLWNELALALGASPGTKETVAKNLKQELSLLVRRRNSIAHEGDLKPTPPREPFPIDVAQLRIVKVTIETIVRGIDSIL